MMKSITKKTITAIIPSFETKATTKPAVITPKEMERKAGRRGMLNTSATRDPSMPLYPERARLRKGTNPKASTLIRKHPSFLRFYRVIQRWIW